MTFATATLADAAPPLRSASLRRLEHALMWLVGFSGGFVFIEPAPYEFAVGLAAVVLLATRSPLRAPHLPLVFLLLVYDIGYLIGVLPVVQAEGTAMWAAVSCFMSVTALFFALAMGQDTGPRLDALLRGYVTVSVIISIFGIITYFHLLPGSDAFIFAQRSKATFKDPNVLSAFLVLPGVLVFQRIVSGRMRDLLLNGPLLAIIAAELLLAFSRGAWGAFAGAAVMLLGFSFFTSDSLKERMRIVIVSVVAIAVLGLLIVAVLSIPQVSGLFAERASLSQSYDSGRFGRFGRHIIGVQMALDNPLGIGPLQFSKYLPEDPHNSFLDSFMAGGWLSGTTYIALILVSVIIGLRFVTARVPWRPAYLAILSSFLALTGESYIIDVQHWRHYFLLLGLIWGLVIASSHLPGKGRLTRT